MPPSSPETTSNMLCLGMSYACVKNQIEMEKVSWDNIIHKHASIEQTVELVRRNILTEMDGRDLARCISMEKYLKTKAYTVSQELGAAYAENHWNGNFNRRNFLKGIKQKWGHDIKFRQIMLDYFWIPQGTWVMNHWARSFFRTTLPGFVEEDLLEFETSQSNLPKNNPTQIEVGVIFLPFCFHCVKQIVSCMKELSNYFTISFVYKSDLKKHALWAGTSKICPNTMQEWLGKQINQEDVYCTFTPRDVRECLDDQHVTKDDVIDVLRRIEDFGDVRMIKLKPLLKYDPVRRAQRSCRGEKETKRSCRGEKERQFGVDIGGFMGLKDPRHIKRGFFDLESEECSSGSEDSSELSEEEAVRPKSKQSRKALKRRDSLPVVSSSDEEKSDGKRRRKKTTRKRKNAIPETDKEPEKVTLLNLCPDIHPTEAEYFDAELEDSSLSASSKRTFEGPSSESDDAMSEDDTFSSLSSSSEYHGVGILLSAAAMMRDAQQSTEPERSQEQAARMLAEEADIDRMPSHDSMDSQDSRSSRVEVVEAREKGTSPSTSPCTKVCKSTETTDSAKSRATSANNEESFQSVNAELGGATVSSSSTELYQRVMIGITSEDRTSASASAEMNGSRARTPPKKGKENLKRKKSGIDRTIGENRNLSLRPEQHAGIAGNRSQQKVSGNTFPYQVHQDHSSLAGSSFQLPYKDPYMSAIQQNISSLPMDFDMRLSRGDLIIRNGGMFLSHVFPSQPAPIYNVIVSLADEGYIEQCGGAIQCSFNPDMTIAELTRFLVEKLNPERWLVALCGRVKRFGSVPRRIVINYGNDQSTEVIFSRADNLDHGKISVGLRLGPGGCLLWPLEKAVRVLSPYGHRHPTVELFTRGVEFQCNSAPNNRIEV